MTYAFLHSRHVETNVRKQQLGNYILLHRLGQGGYASVYFGKHIYLQTHTAIKVLNLSLASHEEVARFEFEARLLASLRHRHIIRTLDFGWERGTPFLVMEYAPGGSLHQVLPRRTALHLTDILPIISQVATALQYLHHHDIVHCDVKPENILLGPRNEVWLGDFGTATRRASNDTLVPKDFRGTPMYLAPEYIYGYPEPASDQYSLAILVYKLLCGRWPFVGTAVQVCNQHLSTEPVSLCQHVSSLPHTIDRIVLKALSKKPAHRFSHVLEFAQALEHACPPYRRGRALRSPDKECTTQPDIAERITHPGNTPCNIL